MIHGKGDGGRLLRMSGGQGLGLECLTLECLTQTNYKHLVSVWNVNECACACMSRLHGSVMMYQPCISAEASKHLCILEDGCTDHGAMISEKVDAIRMAWPGASHVGRVSSRNTVLKV